MISLLEDYKLRKTFWILLLGLTATILLYPVSISPNYPLPVQSIYIFSNFALFLVLFYAWMLLLLTLLFSRRENMMEKLAISLVFAIVFVEFWAFISPWGGTGDAIWQMAHVHYLSQEGNIPLSGHPNFGYFDFPGLQLLALCLANVCDMQIFAIQTAFLLMNVAIFALLVFTNFLNILKSPFYASLGVILMIVGSTAGLGRINYFHPMVLAITFLSFFSLMLSRIKDKLIQSWRENLILVILFAAATIEYLFTPFLFFFIILGIYALYYFRREKAPVNSFTLVVPAIFIISWEIYQTVRSFNTIVSLWPKILEDLLGGRFFIATSQTLTANVGLAYPWWGNATRLFWWSFIFGFGTFLILWKLLNFRKCEHSEGVQLGAFLGVLLTVLVGVMGTRGAIHGGIARYLWVAPFFLVPTLIMFFSRIKVKKYAFTFIFASLLIFSLPTFLTNMDTFCAVHIYSRELQTGMFINSIYERGNGVNLYSYSPVLQFATFYAPESHIITGPEAYGLEEEEMWSAFYGIMDRFHNPFRSPNLFVNSIKAKLQYWEYQKVSPDDPKWAKLDESLLQNNKVYENGLIQLYSP
jgi:hypothetical protein